jgi:hypothetical protein
MSTTLAVLLGDKIADDVERVLWKLAVQDDEVSKTNALKTLIDALTRALEADRAR